MTTRFPRWTALSLGLSLGACASNAMPVDGSTGLDGMGDSTSRDDAGGEVMAAEAGPRDGAALGDARGADVASDAQAGDGGLRSAFFPVGWVPLHAGGSADAMGRFLPDFAYSGYHQGIEPPPCGGGRVVATVDAAAGDGRVDATPVVQAALDAACLAGGGVVAIPAGTYRIVFPEAAPSTHPALQVTCGNLVLRGAGPTTRLWLDDPHNARDRAMILFQGGGALFDSATTTTYPLVTDVPKPSRTVQTASAGTLAVGDYVAIHQDNTAEFRADHHMTDPGLWPSPDFPGLIYARRVTSVSGGAVGLDAPTMYPLTTRDHARLYRVSGFLTEVGLESLALGMTENLTSPIVEPDDDDQYTLAGTTPYEVHAGRAVEFNRVHDGWICDLSSFQPPGNTLPVHLLSNGVVLHVTSFRVTIQDSSLGYPEYRGGGGNGYLFQVQGSDALVRDSFTEHARHGFIINHAASDTVFLRDTIRNSRYTDDAHRFLAHANLYDEIQLDHAWLQSVNRGTTSGGAGFTGSQHVFWNTHVLANHPIAGTAAVESAQWGYGYLLGSSAESGASALLRPMSFTNSGWAAMAEQGDPPLDVVEAEGEVLDPPSLYEAQRALRCAREHLPCR